MADNLELYNKVRTVPPMAQKAITGGRLRGMTDINPMWRIKTLTEQYGPCGFGWKYEITKQWLEPGAKEEIAVFVNINLYYTRPDKTWSEAIPGTGGSMFVAKEKEGLHTSDECYKMALTDALSVACKALGFGADVYWNGDSTKYDKPTQPAPQPPKPAPKAETKAQPVNFPVFWAQCKGIGYSEADVHSYTKCDSLKEWTREQLASLFKELKVIKDKELEGK
jgi:hypothetical protein